MTKKVVSLFSGCGGSSLGYKMAGMDVLAAVEFIPAAAETYRQNHPNTKMFEADIRTISGSDILESIGLEVGELDILDGSPPCASFSMAGAREKLWGKVKNYSDSKQRVDDLFFEYLRIVDEIKPKFAIAENVKGLTMGESKKVLDEIMESFVSIGYKPNYAILKACDYGAPQIRERIFIVATRNDISNKPFEYPKPTHNKQNYVTVKDVIEGLKHDQEELNMLFAAGEKYSNMKFYDEVEVGMCHPVRFNVCKNKWDEPSFTILQTNGVLSAAGLCHPFEKRRHTVAETKRIMGFPDDFILTGTWHQKIERLGRSVCPQVLCALAKKIEHMLSGDYVEQKDLGDLFNI